MIRCSMDLKQSKLTKDEWIAIERPMDGYTDVNLRQSTASTLREFLKVQDSKKSEISYLSVIFKNIIIEIDSFKTQSA